MDILELLKQKPYLLCDGGFGTYLESLGGKTKGRLWSFHAMIDQVDLVERVHRDYWRCGVDIGISGSYQASELALCREGYTKEEARSLLGKSVNVLRDAALAMDLDLDTICLAGCAGPLACYFHDGSEYSGDYSQEDRSLSRLLDFHKPQVNALMEGGADVVLFATIPRLEEVEAIAQVIEFEHCPSWVSLSCQNSDKLASGQSLVEAIEVLNQVDHIQAIGVNCLASDLAYQVVGKMAQYTSKALSIMPNLGCPYDPVSKSWDTRHQSKYEDDFVHQMLKSRQVGAKIFGGCCLTEPELIAKMVQSLN